MAKQRRRRISDKTKSPIQSPLNNPEFKDHRDDEPFHATFMKVGLALFALCAVTYAAFVCQSKLFPPPARRDDDSPESNNHAHRADVFVEKREKGIAYSTSDAIDKSANGETNVTFPTFDLGAESGADVYAIAESPPLSSNLGASAEHSSLKEFVRVASKLRDEFSSRYGGENAARVILARGLTAFQPHVDTERKDEDGSGSASTQIPDGIKYTAHRILRAKEENRPFKMAFGGYSSTLGRGNYFNQSFPFVVERVLTEPMETLGVRLEVRNAAVDGVSSFPYGWCLRNFLGWDADVVSWDFSMNEMGGVAEGLEAYIRHAMTMDHQPMVLLKDTASAKQRRQLLQQYVNMGALPDPVVVHMEPAAELFVSKLPEKMLPPGFKDWKEFGAPAGAPGRALRNLPVKQHELFGWIISMHMLSALEVLAADALSLDGKSLSTNPSREPWKLPAPVTEVARDQSPNDSGATSILFGAPKATKATSSVSDQTAIWMLNPVHCRTSFDPIEFGSLDELIVSGASGSDVDLLLPKGPMFYNKGWTLDLGESEKKEKQRMRQWNGLGFVDSKKAYYGVYTSGPLRLFIPYDRSVGIRRLSQEEDSNRRSEEENRSKGATDSNSFFRSLVVCQVYSPQSEEQCDMQTDVNYVVGGVEAKNIKVIDAEGVSYLGKRLCLQVGIPGEATLTTRKAMDGAAQAGTERHLKGSSIEQESAVGAASIGDIGISLEMRVTNKLVTWRKGPCSVSHVIWEQVRNGDT